jgi:hypothetical protein
VPCRVSIESEALGVIVDLMTMLGTMLGATSRALLVGTCIGLPCGVAKVFSFPADDLPAGAASSRPGGARGYPTGTALTELRANRRRLLGLP